MVEATQDNLQISLSTVFIRNISLPIMNLHWKKEYTTQEYLRGSVEEGPSATYSLPHSYLSYYVDRTDKLPVTSLLLFSDVSMIV